VELDIRSTARDIPGKYRKILKNRNNNSKTKELQNVEQKPKMSSGNGTDDDADGTADRCAGGINIFRGLFIFVELQASSS